MPDMEKVIKAVEEAFDLVHSDFIGTDDFNETEWERDKADALAMLKEQDELLKHEYWRGYNNGRADERGLQEWTIMQTFSPD